MTKRRTLDLPDAPGVWIWKHQDENTPSASVYVFMEDYLLVYSTEDSGYIMPVDGLLDEYKSGKWQGPVEWEERSFMVVNQPEAVRRLEVANNVLSTFARNVTIGLDDRGFIVVAFPYRGETITKRWMARGQDFYPVWHRKLACGGTATTALSQLVRWVKGYPVLPLSTWRYWASDPCKLLPIDAVGYLESGEYPATVCCVLCKQEIAGGLDWWRLDGLSGPCCGWSSGCRQKGKS